MNNSIFWNLYSFPEIGNNIVWTEEKINNNLCFIHTNKQEGFNFLFIKIPKEWRFKIYNKLNILLFDSRSDSDQVFEKYELLNDYLIIKKRDVYNTNNSVTFKIMFYND